MDVRSGRWEKVTPLGEPPSPRAAHAAAAVGNMVVVQVSTVGREFGMVLRHRLLLTRWQCGMAEVADLAIRWAPQGGIGPAGLASEDLHVLDFTDLDKPRWHRYGSVDQLCRWWWRADARPRSSASLSTYTCSCHALMRALPQGDGGGAGPLGAVRPHAGAGGQPLPGGGGRQ